MLDLIRRSLAFVAGIAVVAIKRALGLLSLVQAAVVIADNELIS